jgi:hypothetical protein
VEELVLSDVRWKLHVFMQYSPERRRINAFSATIR